MKKIIPEKPSTDGLAVDDRQRTRLPGHRRGKKSALPSIETVWMDLSPQAIQVSGKHTQARRAQSSRSHDAPSQARNWPAGPMSTHLRPVLNDMDRRFAAMEMIVRLATDPRADERTLHELVLRSLWLFGPEYELAKYCSNATLRTVARKLFSHVGAEFDNERNRPDFVVVPGDPTCGLTSVNVVPTNEGTCFLRSGVLLVELKRGHSTLTRKDLSQADGYAQDLSGTGAIGGVPFVSVWVIGGEVAAGVATDRFLANDHRCYARVRATSFDALIDAAARRLPQPLQKMRVRYSALSTESLRAMLEP